MTKPESRTGCLLLVLVGGLSACGDLDTSCPLLGEDGSYSCGEGCRPFGGNRVVDGECTDENIVLACTPEGITTFGNGARHCLTSQYDSTVHARSPSSVLHVEESHVNLLADHWVDCEPGLRDMVLANCP